MTATGICHASGARDATKGNVILKKRAKRTTEGSPIHGNALIKEILHSAYASFRMTVVVGITNSQRPVGEWHSLLKPTLARRRHCRNSMYSTTDAAISFK
jgi:hypothetical protein